MFKDVITFLHSHGPASVRAWLEKADLFARRDGVPHAHVESPIDTGAEPPTVKRRSAAFSEQALRRWYVEEHVPFYLKNGVMPSRDDDVDVARKIFRDVPREAVFRMRRNHAPPEWTKRGRRKKN